MNIKVVILAAGKGRRMGAEIQKALLPLVNKPMIGHLLDAVDLCPSDLRSVVVYGHGGEDLVEYVQDRAEVALQEKQLGTAHAVMAARDQVVDSEHVLVLYGDSALVSVETMSRLLDHHAQSPAAITMAVGCVQDYEGWRSCFSRFGRILRDKLGNVVAIREAKDCSNKELKIQEVNPGFYVFDNKWLWKNIDQIGSDNAQGELYLTDLVEIAIANGDKVNTVEIPIEECVGCNTPEELAFAEEIYKKKL
jgi:bifunctional UDP-N-acetylglucosamine pyrophosphorylase / glucosamine-1-phosphate N-acetyltransferase